MVASRDDLITFSGANIYCNFWPSTRFHKIYLPFTSVLIGVCKWNQGRNQLFPFGSDFHEISFNDVIVVQHIW